MTIYKCDRCGTVIESEYDVMHITIDNPEREATGIYAICSCCDEKVYQCGEWLFCPNCGADMRGENNET